LGRKLCLNFCQPISCFEKNTVHHMFTKSNFLDNK